MGAVCEKRLTFLCTSPYEYVQYNLRSSLRSVQIKYMFMIKYSD